MIKIEDVTAQSFASLLPLVALYQKFYGAEPNEQRNKEFFSSLKKSEGIQFLAFDGDRPVGFATLYFVRSSVRARVYCLLNDLFVLESERGRGIAKALIQHSCSYAKAQGFDAIEWQTAQSNTVAQKLYDGLPTTRSSWYTYSLPSSFGMSVER